MGRDGVKTVTKSGFNIVNPKILKYEFLILCNILYMALPKLPYGGAKGS